MDVLPPTPKTMLDAFDLGSLAQQASSQLADGAAQQTVLAAAAEVCGRSTISAEELSAVRAALVRCSHLHANLQLPHVSVGTR